jgi:hypothetical protein
MRPRSVSQSRPASRYSARADFDRDFNRSPFSRIPILFRVAVGAIFALTFVIMGFSYFGAAAVESTATGCTVTNKDRTSDGEGGSDMRIYTQGCNDSSAVKVFTVADNWFVGQVASADVFASIEIGKTYDFETRGFRIPVLSQFENIVGVTAK